jgi:hypothetical protein
METVFDLASPQELVALFGADEPDLPDHLRDYALERASALASPDSNFHDLALLFAARGDLNTADKYLAQIGNPELRNSCQLLIYEGADFIQDQAPSTPPHSDILWSAQ